MFVQGLITFTILLLFVWLIWKWVIIPILDARGIEYEETQTSYTKKLERLKEEYKMMETSAQAAEEGVKILEEIKKMEKKILEADEKMEDMK